MYRDIDIISSYHPKPSEIQVKTLQHVEKVQGRESRVVGVFPFLSFHILWLWGVFVDSKCRKHLYIFLLSFFVPPRNISYRKKSVQSSKRAGCNFIGSRIIVFQLLKPVCVCVLFQCCCVNPFSQVLCDFIWWPTCCAANLQCLCLIHTHFCLLSLHLPQFPRAPARTSWNASCMKWH